MKNLGKYSFTILIMASCLILFAVVSVKVLIIEPLAKNAVEDGSPQQEQLHEISLQSVGLQRCNSLTLSSSTGHYRSCTAGR